MSTIRVYAEFYYPKRRPNIKYFLNNQEIYPTVLYSNKASLYLENMILEFDAPFEKINTLSLTMSDKVDNDMLQDGNQWIDHYVEVRDLSLDGIRLESVLYQCGSFTHSMPLAWEQEMIHKGIHIEKIYYNTTQIRLNGTLSFQFDNPIWEWHTKLIGL